MKDKARLVLVVLLIGLTATAVLVYSKDRTKTATSYEDAGGWVYECSQPIPVQDQGATYMSGKPSLTPVNQSDADKYCHKIGIE